MMLYAVCLSAALALVSADAPVEDQSNALRAKLFYPGDPNNPTNNLRVRCSVNVNETNMAGLTKLKMFYSNSSAPGTFKPLGALTDDEVKYGKARTDITVWGKYMIDTDHWSKLDVTWLEENIGFCQYYKCLATGRHPVMNKLLAIYKIIYARAPRGQTC